MPKKRKHNWFIYPKDAHTNEVVARLTDGGTSGFESEALTAICEDGKSRNLWRISETQAWILWRSRKDLKFDVFNQVGAGKIRNVTKPLFRKERRSPKKAQKRVSK